MVAWEIRQRDYAAEITSAKFEPAEAKHPLLEAANRLAERQAAEEAAAKKAEAAAAPAAAAAAEPKTADDPLSAAAVDDPLGAAIVNDDPLGAVAVSVDPLGGSGADPLSGGGAAAPVLPAGGTTATTAAAVDVASPRAADWKARRALIIKQYAAAGSLKVNSDLLEVDGVSAGSLGSNIDEAGPSGEKKVALDKKTRSRLEQLQEQEEDGRSVRLTQAEVASAASDALPAPCPPLL